MNFRQVFCVVTALIGFAANSLLTRAAIGSGSLDPASFAFLRIVTGAVVLTALAHRSPPRQRGSHPSWLAAVALTAYLAAFTAAYTRIGAATGALLLFGAVQLTMVTAGLVQGERPAQIDWVGALLALAGLLVLTLPGTTAPDVFGALLMVAAGACWGVYSLLGRGSVAALSDTARNFVRASLLSAIPLAWWGWPPQGTAAGVGLATASGTLASGLGYTFWYAALPALSAWHAAVLQLIVPVLTAGGAWLFLGEPLTWRLAAAGGLVALGVWFTSSPQWHAPR
jgi:drug/metabolite transporter (DMT)-like permease